MWGASLLNPARPFFSTTNLPPEIPPAAHTRRRFHPPCAGGLGKAVFGALQSDPNNNPGSNPNPGNKKNGKRETKTEEKEKGKELTGSDILRALQRAGARKAQISTIKKQQRKMTDPVNRRDNPNRVVDYDKIRPLTIRTDWATRLDELEKRLQQLINI